MRWYTCTPVAFGGGADFFARDSGLLSRGFREIGVESKAVMPGAPKPEDEEGLIRTDFTNLESIEWWKSHELDGVVLYAWGAPRFRQVAKAIRKSGTFLVLNQDSSGAISPLCGISSWVNEQWVIHGGGTSLRSTAHSLACILKGATIGLLRTDPLRAKHLKQGNLIGALHPEAAANYRKLCRIYGGNALSDRVVILPHAVTSDLAFEETIPKQNNRIISIGRWDDTIQKRPGLLMETLGLLLSDDPDAKVDIVGRGSEVLESWVSSLPPTQSARVKIHGKIPHEKIKDLLLAASIYYCPSSYESFNIAAAEALCSGCSVVSADLPTMASFRWFTGKASGSLAQSDDSQGHAGALIAELNHWRAGQRKAAEISAHWAGFLHADKVAKQVLALTGQSR